MCACVCARKCVCLGVYITIQRPCAFLLILFGLIIIFDLSTKKLQISIKKKPEIFIQSHVFRDIA